MSHDCAVPDGERLWTTSEGVHLDVRGLDCPEPVTRILGAIDSGAGGSVLVVHLDEEPVTLYPELDERGWSYEVVPMCSHHDSDDGIMVKLVRLTPDRAR